MARKSCTIIHPVPVCQVVSSTIVPGTYRRCCGTWALLGPNRKLPADRSSSAANTLGESGRGRHSHSTAPFGATRQLCSQFDKSAYSAMGGNVLTCVPYLSNSRPYVLSCGGIGWMVRLAFVCVCAGWQWRVVDGERPFAAVVADEGGPPAQDGAEAVAEAGEEADVDEQPHHPAHKAAEMQPEGGDDRAPARDVGGRAQVVVAERLAVGVALGLLSNPAGGVEPGVHGDLGDPGQLVQAHQVPGHQVVGMVREGKVDEGHLDLRPPQRPRREKPGEPAPDDHHPAGARCCGHGSPRPFVASCDLRALMLMVIAREPGGITLIEGFVGAGADPAHLHSGGGMPHAHA